MPTLTAVANVPGTDLPFVWICSACDCVFALEKLTTSPTRAEVMNVHQEFARHCLKAHRGPDMGLTVPYPIES